MTKKNVTGIRYSEPEKRFLKRVGLGFQRVFNIGIQSLYLSLHECDTPPCIYLYNTGKNRAPPALGLAAPESPPAHHCCCPVCPIRNAFGSVPHQKETPGLKENEPVLPIAAALYDMEDQPGKVPANQ
jgi:hypothetical protein